MVATQDINANETNMPQEPSSLVLLSTLAGGWIALAAIGTAFTVAGYPLVALLVVSAIGITCSVKGFGGCEMLFAMIVSTVLGGILAPLTAWAWLAPMLPGGFMVSVVASDLFGE